jgi:uncharacterized membrane protein
VDETTASAVRRAELPISLVAAVGLLAGSIIFLWYAPTSYEIYKALHVGLSVIWVGGGVLLTILALLAERTDDPERLMAVGRQAEFAGARIFTPASLAVFAFGVAMIEKGNLNWGDFWLVFAIVGWGISAATGIFFLAPRVKKLNELAATHGVEHPETQRRLKTVLGVARLDVALLLLIVVDMTAKPFL